MLKDVKTILKYDYNYFIISKDNRIIYYKDNILNILNKNIFKRDIIIEFEENIQSILSLINNHIIIKFSDKLKIISFNDKNYTIIQEIKNINQTNNLIKPLKYNKYIFSIINKKKVNFYSFENSEYFSDKEIQTEFRIRHIIDIKNNKAIIICKESCINKYYISLYNLGNNNIEKTINIDLSIYGRLTQLPFERIASFLIKNQLILSISSFLYLIDINSFDILHKELYHCDESILYKKRLRSCTMNRQNRIFLSSQINSIIYKKNMNIFLGNSYYYIFYFKIDNCKIKIIQKENLEKSNLHYFKIDKNNNIIAAKHDYLNDIRYIIIYELKNNFQ